VAWHEVLLIEGRKWLDLHHTGGSCLRFN